MAAANEICMEHNATTKSKGTIRAGEMVMVRAGLPPLKPAAKKSAETLDARDLK